jgi:GxxExxY protein
MKSVKGARSPAFCYFSFMLGPEEFPLREATYKVIGIAMDVHDNLGKGYLEVIYQDALEREFRENSIIFEREREFPIIYKGKPLPRHYKVDFVVYSNVLIEVKAQPSINVADVKQTLNYLACSKLQVGLILNFGEPSLTFKRVILS